MDKLDSDLVNLQDMQADQTDVTGVHLRTTQEDIRMLQPEVVDRIRELSGQGLGSKRIARMLGVSRNSVRRYLAGATVGFQERPSARRLDSDALREVHDLFGTVAEGNAVVIQQELASRGIHVELRTLQRAVLPLRQEERAETLATVRFETPPGQQMQIDFGEKIVRIAGQPVKIYLMTAVLGYSRRLYCRAFLAQRQDDWLEGLDGAFRQFGGLTEQILCDNASPLVVSHDRESGDVVWNPGFEAFCRDRGLFAKACRPRRARTKGSNAVSATSSTMLWPDARSIPSPIWNVIWPPGKLTSLISGFTARPGNGLLIASSAMNGWPCGPCRHDRCPSAPVG
jgi:transposase